MGGTTWPIGGASPPRDHVSFQIFFKNALNFLKIKILPLNFKFSSKLQMLVPLMFSCFKVKDTLNFKFPQTLNVSFAHVKISCLKVNDPFFICCHGFRLQLLDMLEHNELPPQQVFLGVSMRAVINRPPTANRYNRQPPNRLTAITA